MEVISYGRQTVEDDDIMAVADALGREMITQGPLVEAFEEALCEYTGAKYSVVCSSGTAALILAYLAAKERDGDGVITSTITFVATANSALHSGLNTAFCDIDPETHNIDPDVLEMTCSELSDVRIITPVHFAGLPCDMERIRAVADERGLVVIEDACHALGAEWRDSAGGWHKVGSSSHSEMTVFSFHPVKSITTCEGGAVTTNDLNLYRCLKELREHGITREGSRFDYPGNGPWYYEMHTPGYNFRLSDIQCALGLSQLGKLDRFVARRREIASLYTELLRGCDFITTPAEDGNRRSAWHLYPVSIDFEGLGVDKARWFDSMKQRGVRLQVHYIPVHLQPYYRRRYGYTEGDFPVAEEFYRSEVSLPIYPLLTDDEVERIAAEVIETLTVLQPA